MIFFWCDTFFLWQEKEEIRGIREKRKRRGAATSLKNGRRILGVKTQAKERKKDHQSTYSDAFDAGTERLDGLLRSEVKGRERTDCERVRCQVTCGTK